MSLTGNTRYRQNWRGRMILQVEESYTDSSCIGGYVDVWPAKRWRDARLSDLQVEFKP